MRMTPAEPGTAARDAAKIAALKQRTATASVIASVVLTLGKAAAALVSGSLTLFAEALHGLIDIGATIASWFAIRGCRSSFRTWQG
jgi:divalent metal cation (Fe/Co/Zn/Cd) transporter